MLLNLYYNAFYATQQRKNTEGDSYKPQVTVTTAQRKGFVEIKVVDKPTGEGIVWVYH